MNLDEYCRSRSIPRWLAHLRKLFSLPGRFAYGKTFRRQCLRWMGVRIGESYVGRDCLFDEEAPELITIGNGVTISSRVIIVTHDSSRNLAAPVRIADEAFVGIGAIVLPGVTIGERAVVGAGAVVTRSVQSGSTVIGSPARPLRV
jgi:acetyltransferase-like isoleucine patch superfamily enzyme